MGGKKQTDEEKEAEFLKHPQNRTFWRRLAFSLCVTGLNSQVWDWYKMPKNKIMRIQRIVIIIFEPVTTWSQIVFFCQNYKDYSFASMTMTSMLTIIPICTNIMMTLFVAQSKPYKLFLKKFMNEFHLHNLYKRDPEDTFVKQTLITVERYTKNTLICFAVGLGLCSVAWEAVPIRHNIMDNPDLKNITTRLEVVIHIWLPFDYEYNFNNWFMVQTLAMYCSFIGISMLIIFDTLLISSMYHFIGHVNIFINKLKTNFPAGQTQKDIKVKLVELFIYYNWIKDALGILEGAYGWYVVYIYMQNLTQGGILLYILTSQTLGVETLLTFGLMIPYLQGFLVLLSYVLEYIRIRTDDIPNLVYFLPWEDMSVSNQKMVWMLLYRVQPTFEFKAACNTKTGVQPAINIIKTTFSYYVMIKARSEGN